MTEITRSFDPELWQLVPKKATHEMIMALSVSPDFMGQHIIRHSIDKLPDAYEAALRAAPTPPASAQSVEPYDYVYEFDGPFGVHRSFSANQRNGRGPSRTVPVYTPPPSTEGARDAALEEAAITAEEPHLGVYPFEIRRGIAERIRALKSKKEA